MMLLLIANAVFWFNFSRIVDTDRNHKFTRSFVKIEVEMSGIGG